MVWDFSNSKYNEEECLYLVSLRQSISESVHNTHWTDVYKRQGYVLSGGVGYIHRKVWSLSGIDIDPYIYVLKPCLGATYDFDKKFSELVIELCDHNVPFVLPTSVNLFTKFCNSQVTKSQGKALFKKYAGNLLTSNYVPYPHYIIPVSYTHLRESTYGQR